MKKNKGIINLLFICVILFLTGCNTLEETDNIDQNSQNFAQSSQIPSEIDHAEPISQSEPNPDESLYAYTAELEEIPELGRCSTTEMNLGSNYICYKDILVLTSTIYKKETERYVKQDLTLNSIFDVQNELLGVDARQYKNLIVALSQDDKSFLIYDMDTDTVYCCCSAEEGMEIGPFWCVYDGCIYYSEWTWESKKERTLKKVNLLNNSVEEIYRPEKGKNNCSFGAFGIREDGAIMYKVHNGDYREYWIAEKEGNGEWNERKLWEYGSWEFEYLLDVNQYGMIVMGTMNTTVDLVVIKDNGETLKLDEDSIYGEYLFTDKGYFSSNLAELEHMPWDNDDVESEWLSRYLADSVSFYDYEGNLLSVYPMISKELLEQGYYLAKLTYNEGKLTGFYVQRDTEELYISQIDVDELPLNDKTDMEGICLTNDITSLNIQQEIEDYMTHLTELYSTGTMDASNALINIEESEIALDDSGNVAALVKYSDNENRPLRYRVELYGETMNTVINYYLCSHFVLISKQNNYYSSQILTAGWNDILYSEMEQWILWNDRIYVLSDNSQLEEIDKEQLTVPMVSELEKY